MKTLFIFRWHIDKISNHSNYGRFSTVRFLLQNCRWSSSTSSNNFRSFHDNRSHFASFHNGRKRCIFGNLKQYCSFVYLPSAEICLSSQQWCDRSEMVEKENNLKLKKSENVSVKKEVQVFDSTDLFIGKMTFRNASDLAEKENKTLVLMNKDDKAEIKSYKITAKSTSKSETPSQKKDKNRKLKKISIGHTVSDHDLQTKIKKMRKDIEKKHKLEVVISPASRKFDEEKVKPVITKLMHRIQDELEDIAIIRNSVMMDGVCKLIFYLTPVEQKSEDD